MAQQRRTTASSAAEGSGSSGSGSSDFGSSDSGPSDFGLNGFGPSDFAATGPASTGAGFAVDRPTVWPFATGSTGATNSIHATGATNSIHATGSTATTASTEAATATATAATATHSRDHPGTSAAAGRLRAEQSSAGHCGEAQPGAPLTRRQLRDLVGPLVVAGVDDDAQTA
jgi:hypothetical protein